ncbi:MAG: Uma2 family endonuclease, partial [Gemmatimonadetes bacterium]|nr:Uma2 family endonuclease [Gemmatimonadota bacterium]
MPVQLNRRRFTVDEYYAMAEAGILTGDDRVELIEGEIVQMAAIGSHHAACVDRLTRMLVQQTGDAAVVRVQNPVRLSDLSEP